MEICFAEKALMLMKASLMGDKDAYRAIEAATTPAEAKNLGRYVEPWNNDLWQSHVCEVARHLIVSKFAVPELKHHLLKTGERLIAEAARNDCVWGIGMDGKNPAAKLPFKWRGANVLGWALMEARTELRRGSIAAVPSCIQTQSSSRRDLVVHCRKSPFEVYVGRPHPTIQGVPGAGVIQKRWKGEKRKEGGTEEATNNGSEN